MTVVRRTTAVPAAGRFPTVDEVVRAARELVRRRPEHYRLRRVGTSRAGAPLWLLSAGRGGCPVLVVAGPHANEPTGGATVLRLAALAPCKELSWHFLLCLDPDGARLNETWLPGPYEMSGYFRGMYRPAPEDQPEWLPKEPGQPMLPETAALLRVLDELRPAVQFSLHSTDGGGTFMQLTRKVPGASQALCAAAAGLAIPCEVAPFDAFHLPSPGPGTFEMSVPPVSRYDLSARSTWFRPVRHGTVTAVIEAPLWAVEGVGELRSTVSRQGSLEEAAAVLRSHGRQIGDLLAEAGRRLPLPPGALLSAATAAAEACAVIAEEWLTVPNAAACEGNAVSLRVSAQRIPLRAAGMLARTLAPLTADGAAELRTALDKLLVEWCERYEVDFRPRAVPVRAQVELQVRTILGVTEAVRRGG